MGIDVAYNDSPVAQADSVFKQARAEGRILITASKSMIHRTNCPRHLFVPINLVDSSTTTNTNTTNTQDTNANTDNANDAGDDGKKTLGAASLVNATHHRVGDESLGTVKKKTMVDLQVQFVMDKLQIKVRCWYTHDLFLSHTP